MNLFNLELQKLFQEKKYNEVIDKIENYLKANEKSAGLLNILGVSRVLSFSKDVSILDLALKNFEEAYIREKNTQIGLDALTNFINLFVQIFDIKKNINNFKILEKDFKKILKIIEEAESYFGYNHKLYLSIVKFHKRQNNIDKSIYYLKKIFENKNADKDSMCSYIYYNSFKYGWTQKDFFIKSKNLNSYCSAFNQNNLLKLNLKKNGKTRIGFLSSDIHNRHSVTHFLKTVLNNYNKDKFEIYLYLNNK